MALIYESRADVRVPLLEHFDFSALADLRVMESFAFAGNVYAGVQRGIWFYDEFYWSERKGSWAGVLPMPARECVGNLRLVGATRETFGTLNEPLDRLASGQALLARGEILYHLGRDVPDSATNHRLYSCATGDLIASAGLGGVLGVVPDGSYLLWARTFGDELLDTGFGMARLRDGEWSALRVAVGNSAWSVAPGVCPSPGAALYAKAQGNNLVVVTPDNEADFRVAFDPLARCVSASCVLEHALRTRSGQFLVPEGSLLIGGLRASASGPQSALWVLHSDGTSRVLGLQTEFTDGVCECAKTNHHASDVVQAPDGSLFVLSECALFRFDPDAASVYEALQGYPAQSKTPAQWVLSQGAKPEAGDPGGNCLRFPRGEMVHWTEDNTGREKSHEFFYNRIVRRVSGRDAIGPGTLWHGTNCAETFLGRFWAIRGERLLSELAPDASDSATPASLTGTLYLDWIDGGEWHGYTGMKRDLNQTFWQRLRRLGNTLFLFGYAPGTTLPIDKDNHTDGQPPLDATGQPIPAPTGVADVGAHAKMDAPTCAVADGVTLRDAVFPFFVRRATPSFNSLFVAARGASEGVGPANRVVEITGARTHICSFWDEETGAFSMSRAAFESLGGDPAKLPAFLVWHARSGTNGGGVWKPALAAPTTGFWLQTFVDETSLRFQAKPSGELPYNPSTWNRLCFDVLGDGTVDGPFIEPTCDNAQCVFEQMPDGTKFRPFYRPVPDAANPATSLQVTDASLDNRLGAERDIYPTLFLRYDSTESTGDLSSYTHLAPFGRLVVPEDAAKTRIEGVVLVSPANQMPHFPFLEEETPILSRRT